MNFDTPANFKKKLNEFIERNNYRPVTGIKYINLPRMKSLEGVNNNIGNTLWINLFFYIIYIMEKPNPFFDSKYKKLHSGKWTWNRLWKWYGK